MLRVHRTEGGEEWAAISDVMIAFCLVLMVIIPFQWLLEPEDIVRKLIKKGQSIIIGSLIDEAKSNGFIIQGRADGEISFFHNEGRGLVIAHRTDGYLQRIILQNEILFDRGDYHLSERGASALSIFSAALKQYQNRVLDTELDAAFFYHISVEGHTDDDPFVCRPRCPFLSTNWQLSSFRAVAALEELVRQGIDARTISATGYSHWRPMSNDKAENRRVEIVLVYSPEAVAQAVNEYGFRLNAR